MLERRGVLAAGVGVLAPALAGCLAGDGGDSTPTDSPSPTPEPPLSVAKLVFCADEPGGYDDFETQPDGTYAPDETVWVYLEIDGLVGEDTDDGVHIDLEERVEVTDPDGNLIVGDDIRFDQTFGAGTDLDTFFVTNNVTLPANPASGEYTFAVELTDVIGGKETSEARSFTVEGS